MAARRTRRRWNCCRRCSPSADLEATVELREVLTDEEAETLRFPGSPTIRVDGRDVDPAGAEARPALACRIYHLAGRARLDRFRAANNSRRH